MSDYLWDKTGEPEEDVEQLENLLGALKYQPRPLEIPASAMPTPARPTTMFFSRPRLAIAASLILMLLAGVWLTTRQSEWQKNELAKANNGSETVGSKQTERAVGTNETKGGNVAVNNTEVDNPVVNSSGATKANVDKAISVTASAPKVQRVPRRLIAARQKIVPRVNEKMNAGRQELVAANGGMHWEVEQPLTPQQREATEQLMLALRVASAKFNYAQREMQEMGRAGK
jgi:hypothetical protein